MTFAAFELVTKPTRELECHLPVELSGACDTLTSIARALSGSAP